jgi:hypothetical protein
MEGVKDFNGYCLSDGTIVNVRTLRPATEIRFISQATANEIRFYAWRSSRAYAAGEARDSNECPEVIVWTIGANEYGFRQYLERSGIKNSCLDEFFAEYQNGTGSGCWVGRRRARSKVELRFENRLPQI